MLDNWYNNCGEAEKCNSSEEYARGVGMAHYNITYMPFYVCRPSMRAETRGCDILSGGFDGKLRKNLNRKI